MKSNTIKIILLFLLPGIQVAQAQNTIHNYSGSEEAETAIERISAQFDSLNILETVQKKTGASKADMDLFAMYYADKLNADREKWSVVSSQWSDSEHATFMEHFAAEKTEEYVKMYRKFEELKKEFPSTVAEYAKPHIPKIQTGVCNPSCTNIDFSSGDLSGWNAFDATNNSSAAKFSYTAITGGACGAVTKSAIDVVTNRFKSDTTYQVTITNGAGNDPIAGALIPVVAPGAKYSCRIGDSSVGGSRVGILQQTFQVSAGNTDFTYNYAVLIDQANHSYGQQPYFSVIITDVTTGDTLPCGVYTVVSGPHSGFTPIYYKIPAYGWYDSIYCKPWSSVYVSLQKYIGHCISVQATVSDCFPTAIGPHFCYAYFEASCGTSSLTSSNSCGSATITAPAGGTYSWAGPCITGSTTSQSATVNCSGTYTVTITSPDGCSDTLQKVITIAPSFTLATTSVNAICSNTGSATVTVNGGTAPYTYSWNPGGNTNATATGLGAGTYTVNVSDNAGCTQTATAIVNSKNGETATIGAITGVSCFNGTNGSATVNVAGGLAPYTYSWNPSGQTNAMANGLSAGTYTVNVADANGCISSATAPVTQPAALAINTSITNVSCFGGNNGIVSAKVSGGTIPYTYSWNISAQTTATVSGLSAGAYTLTLTDANGCTSVANAAITQPAQLVPAMGTPTNIVCNGGNNGSATVSITGGTTPYAYSWSPAGGKGATGAGLTAGNYTVAIKDKNLCITTDSVTLTQPPPITTTMGAPTNVTCNGENNGSVTVTAGGGTPGYRYVWSPAGGTDSTATGLNAGTFTVLIIDNSGCPDSATAVITQPPPIIITSQNQNICPGQSATLTATAAGGAGSPYSYSWSTGGTGQSITVFPAITTSYTVTAIDASGCSSTLEVIVSLVQPPALTVSPPISICEGNSVTLTATGSAGTYTWQPGNLSGSIITVTPSATTTYTVTLTALCTSITNSVTITVFPMPAVAFTSGIRQGCSPLCIQFSDESSGIINQWRWAFGNGDTSDVQNPIYCYRDSGTYTVSLTVTTNIGCSSTLKILDMITVFAHPVAAFTYTPQPVTILAPAVQFTDHSTDPYGIAYWWWTFGDSEDSLINLQNPSHTYQDTGIYCAKLVVMNIHGCTDTAVQCLPVIPVSTLYIPSAFSPNGDGLNDVFTAKGVYIKTFEMYIYDRWGMKLYHTTDINKGWDGRVEGGSQICQEDTYVYIIYATDALDNKNTYTGRVTLIK